MYKKFNPYLAKAAALGLLFSSGHVLALDCSQLANWDPNPAYLGGDQVQHNDVAYQANWWSQNSDPATHSGPFQEWSNLGACDDANQAPEVTISSPLDGSTFSQNDSVVISANATDADGSVEQVEFLLNDQSLAVDNTAPFSIQWQALTGNHQIQAIATDNLGKQGSASVGIQVQNPNNVPPQVSLTFPLASTQINPGDTVNLSADASDADGTIQQVDFYVNDTRVGSDTSAPYQTQWQATSGSHSFKAKAVDDGAAETFSATVNLTVAGGGGCAGLADYVAGTAYQANQEVQHQNNRYRCDVAGWCSSAAGWAYTPGAGLHWQDAWTDLGVCSISPEVTIDSPADNALLLSGQQVRIEVQASDQDGSVTQVEFFAADTSLGVDTLPPYSLDWTANQLGEVQLRAVATDNENNTAAATLLVTVSDEPIAVSLTKPVSGSTVRLGDSLNLSADASSVVSNITQVSFSVNGSVIGTDNTAPYQVPWTPGSVGSYQISANAVDASGNQASSSAHSVNVTEAPIGKTHKLIGYWHNFQNPAGCPFRLADISDRWDVIDIAFADNDINSNGTVHFNLFTGAGSSCAGIDPVQFKQDIADLQARGKVVVLSLGGAEGTITLNTDEDQVNFVSSLTDIINEWGFDGLDIDLESGSNLLHGTQIQARLPVALKQIEQNIGGNMYLTMAPEHPYVQGGMVAYTGIWGAYIPLIDELRDTLDLLHVQLYNNGGLSHPYGSQPAREGSVDMMVASARMLLEGFTLADGSEFQPLRDDQVAFGLPSGPASANSGQAPAENIADALDCMIKGTGCGTITTDALHPNFGGVMTWSINWDIHDGFNFSGPVGDKLDALNAGQ